MVGPKKPVDLEEDEETDDVAEFEVGVLDEDFDDFGGFIDNDGFDDIFDDAMDDLE